MAKGDQWRRILEPYIVSAEENEHGELRMRCPLHGDVNPSATINFKKDVWNCNASCGGGKIATLARKVKKRQEEEDVEEADYDPFEDNVVDIDVARAKKEGTEPKAEISEGIVLGWHKTLIASKAVLNKLMQRRGIDEKIIKQYKIGFERQTSRYTIPVHDADGALVNVRRYDPDGEGHQKMWNLQGYGSPPRLYPIDQMQSETILLTEGELDALVSVRHGVPAVTGTGGANKWSNDWSRAFAGKRVVICYDNDRDGRTGAKKAARSLRPHAAKVAVMESLVKEHKGDVTDWFLAGGTGDQLRALMETALEAAEQKEEQSKAEPDGTEAADVQVLGSMDSRTNGKPLRMAVTITGKKNPTYSFPHKAVAECTLDAGNKCKLCPMNLEWEGEHNVTIGGKDVKTIARFIDAPEEKRTELVRKHIGAVKCSQFEVKVTEAVSVEEIFVTSSIDKRNAEATDYTQRRVYNIGSHETPTNTTANVIGTTWPNPKDGRNEFFSWDLKEAQTSLDNFKMAPDTYKRLKVFQCADGQTPLQKCREIAVDLGNNVTHIKGRERLHVAMDLVWHSVMHFPLDNKVISRGWLEFLVVGDTRTGKSETAIRLSDHYGLGHVIGCEGATFAGLVGAVRQIADAWTVTWGEITINDRRLVVLDEASGLSQDLISQLSDIRSRGEAQLTKVESQQTRARTRMIWISNPRRSKYVDEKRVDGIDVIEDLIGNKEDIARFDFAMSVSMSDVDLGIINNPDDDTVIPHIFTSDLCNELILWAWSRKADQIEWKPDAYRYVYTAAEKLSQRYVDHPPLIQGTNVREKIARLSVAFAARTFSCDDSGERIVLEVAHVKSAMKFLDELYSYDNFGYRRLSKRIARNRKIAANNRAHIKKWLKENKRLMEFLMDRKGSFRAPDLEEMAYMQRDEVNNVLGKLSDAKMISKEKSQIIIEPELHSILKEMER